MLLYFVFFDVITGMIRISRYFRIRDSENVTEHRIPEVLYGVPTVRPLSARLDFFRFEKVEVPNSIYVQQHFALGGLDFSSWFENAGHA